MKVSAIDESALKKLYDLQDDEDPDLVGDLIRMFFDLTPKRVARLTDALRTGDARRIETEAHDLKSSAANLGATSLSAVAAEIEKMGRKGSIEGVQEALERLNHEFDRAKDELARRLN